MDHSSTNRLSYSVMFMNQCDWATLERSGLSQVYEFWEGIWRKTFSESGKPPENWTEDFFCHDVVTVLKNDDQIIGCHLYSFYNLLTQSNNSYFEYLKTSSVKKVMESYGPKAMTMEYLCAQKPAVKLPVSPGACMIALGARLALFETCGSVLGMPIEGTKVSGRVENLGMGAQLIENGIQKYGYNLSFLATCPKWAVEHEPQIAHGFLNELWDRRKILGTSDDILAA